MADAERNEDVLLATDEEKDVLSQLKVKHASFLFDLFFSRTFQKNLK